MLFCTLYGEVGLKGYAEISCKIIFSKNSQKIGVQNNIVETLQVTLARMKEEWIHAESEV